MTRDADENPKILRAQVKDSGANWDAGEPRGHNGYMGAMLTARAMPSPRAAGVIDDAGEQRALVPARSR
jgi:hypothetical protein